jgi:hypothetical protein
MSVGVRTACAVAIVLAFAAPEPAAHSHGSDDPSNTPIVVGPAPCPVSTIPDAIDLAASRPGADVIVLTGSFSNQALVINDAESLTIRRGGDPCNGAEPPARVTISGIGNHFEPYRSVVSIIGSGAVTLSGLRLTAGLGSAHRGIRHGGGVFHAGSGLLTMENVAVDNNEASFGSGGTGPRRPPHRRPLRATGPRRVGVRHQTAARVP